MKVFELAKILHCELICGKNNANNDIDGCYIGDLLSLAMSKVQKGNVWITIQSNINIAAIATLTEAGLIIICDGFMPDDNTRLKAEEENIPIISSDKSAYEIAKILAGYGI